MVNIHTMTRPSAVSVASFLIACSGAMLGAWAVATFSRFGQFSWAAEKIFDADPDADTSVTKLRLVFFAGAALSMIFACALLGLAFFVYHKHNWARISAAS
jgi:hypothetical protein